ncbi:unnamed protein product, partial [Ectocarpus sp. 12 AP-2014]
MHWPLGWNRCRWGGTVADGVEPLPMGWNRLPFPKAYLRHTCLLFHTGKSIRHLIYPFMPGYSTPEIRRPLPTRCWAAVSKESSHQPRCTLGKHSHANKSKKDTSGMGAEGGRDCSPLPW